MSRLSEIIRAVIRRTSRRPLRPETAPKPPLLLHIGPHKTGTTAVQLFCVRNRKHLARAGFWYPEVGISSAQHMLLPGCYFDHHPCMHESLVGGDPEELVATLASERPRGLTPLLSSEVFWELLSQQPDDFESVVALLGEQFHVHFLIVERPVCERLWSGIKHQCRDGWRVDAVEQFRGGQAVFRHALARLMEIGCPLIRIPYDPGDCVAAFLGALSLQRFPRKTVRPRQMSGLIRRCRAEFSNLRENCAPPERWLVAFTIELSRRLLLVAGPGGRDDGMTAFVRQVLAVGSELESVHLLPDEDVVFHRVVEAGGPLTCVLSPEEVRAWESVCQHPAVQRAAMRTGCVTELKAVSQFARQLRVAA